MSHIHLVGRYPKFVVEDLNRSGLSPEDMSVRVVDSAERAATQTAYSIEGYVIPYFEISGRPKPYYRVRLFEADAKYKQPKDSQNHVYFPKLFQKALRNKSYVLVTEGEKKATAACKAGFPCVAFGGVDSWRTRTIVVPGDAQLSQHQNKLAIKVPQGGEIVEEYDTNLAVGLLELIDLVVTKKLNIIIVYDSDNANAESGTKTEVQRAAAALGYELRFRGIPFVNIRQLILPSILDFEYDSNKVGLDDYLVHEGDASFREMIDQTLRKRSAFPKHPNIRDYVNRRLMRSRMPRKEMQSVAMAILSDMDSRGMRVKDATGEAFYFDYETRRLLRAEWSTANNQGFNSKFNQFMYSEYGLSAADQRLTVWLGTQFASEEPIDLVTPHRILWVPPKEDKVYFQISDASYVCLTATELIFCANGENNVLFEADHCETLDQTKLLGEFNRQKRLVTSKGQVTECWWANTLNDVRLRDRERQRVACALLYYLSPWLFRWKGMQLPVELIVGESGSGKSTLCELRLEILTGRPVLRNTPTDIKDWHASVTNSGGLHITDNVQLVDRNLRQKLSDEICRIVTEPNPFIEQRKYFTNAELIRFPVRTVFAITSIQQPFQNTDLLQRAFTLELDKQHDLQHRQEAYVRYDSEWKEHKIQQRGGREAWVAHHLVVLQCFFRSTQKIWQQNYQAKHRLINLEQAMITMAHIFGFEDPRPEGWIPDYLVQQTDRAVSESDWVLEGLQEFAKEFYHPTHGCLLPSADKGGAFRVTSIVEWALGKEEHMACEVLINARKLGRYMRAHKATIYALTGIQEWGSDQNRVTYKFIRTPPVDRGRGESMDNKHSTSTAPGRTAFDPPSRTQ